MDEIVVIRPVLIQEGKEALDGRQVPGLGREEEHSNVLAAPPLHGLSRLVVPGVVKDYDSTASPFCPLAIK